MGNGFGLSFETYRVTADGETTPVTTAFREAEGPGRDNDLPPCQCRDPKCTVRGGRP